LIIKYHLVFQDIYENLMEGLTFQINTNNISLINLLVTDNTKWTLFIGMLL